MTIKPIHIGIIGGMGPQASIRLHELIIELVAAEFEEIRCHQFPLITHLSLPIKDFISDPSLRHESLPLLRHAQRVLEDGSVDIAVLACNTAHLLLDDVPQLKRLPLVSLPQSTIKKAQNDGVTKLGLLASPTTFRMHLYEKHAIEAGLSILKPNQSEQKIVEKVIRTTISGHNGPLEQRQLKDIASSLQSRGAQRVALGCTELSVVMKNNNDPIFIDSLKATSEEIVRRTVQKKQQVTE